MPQFADAAQAEEFSDYLKTGLDWIFEDSLPTHDKMYKVWLSESSADEYTEDSIVHTGLGAMPSKDVGGKITVDKPYTSAIDTHTIRTWAIAYVAEYELVRWDRYRIFGDMTKEMTKSAVDRCNILAFSILNNGFSTSDGVYQVYNGENLFDATHALLGDSGTTSNRSSTNAALAYAALQSAITDFLMLQNERGLYVRLKASHLQTHPSNEWFARTLMQSTQRPGTANNDANTLPEFGVSSSPYLTSTTAWFLSAKPKQLRVRFRVGDKPMHRKDFDHSTWNSVMSCYQSNRVEVQHYQGIWGSDGTGS